MSAAAILRRVCLRAYRLALRRIQRGERAERSAISIGPVVEFPLSKIAILRDELSLCAVEAIARMPPIEDAREEAEALSALVSAVDREQVRAENMEIMERSVDAEIDRVLGDA